VRQNISPFYNSLKITKISLYFFLIKSSSWKFRRTNSKHVTHQINLLDKNSCVKAVAGGNHVVVHCHQEWPGDRDKDWASIDIFRLDDSGKIVEHWDVLRVVPEKSANNNTMF
jgi:predicted SnoaL-like aldol condensation-catalyzing enzyme